MPRSICLPGIQGLSCSVTAGPLAHFVCWSGIEGGRIKITKTEQLNISCAVEATSSSSFYLFLTSADHGVGFFWRVFVSSRGKISLGVDPYTILETKPSTCISCCFLKCPLHPKISITQERSDQPVLLPCGRRLQAAM